MNILQSDVILIDAFGVLYNYEGLLPGSKRIIKTLQNHKRPFFIVTNNTFLSRQGIAQQFQDYGLEIEPDQVISSGVGLKYDTTCQHMIQNKHVFVVGQVQSHSYIEEAGGIVCESLKQAQTIVLAASLGKSTQSIMDTLIAYLSKHPETPIICINPDRHVRDKGTKRTVIGYYADKLSCQITQPIYWMGKPLPTFSKVVMQILKEKMHPISMKQICFIDDYLPNVIAMHKHCGFYGICVTQTGLSTSKEWNAFHKKNSSFTGHSISTINALIPL